MADHRPQSGLERLHSLPTVAAVRPAILRPGTLRSDVLHEDMDAVLAAALSAVEPSSLVERVIEDELRAASLREPETDLLLIAAGKAAVGMAKGAFRAVGSRIHESFILVPRDTPDVDAAAADMNDSGADRRVRIFRGAHPLPDDGGVEGATAVRDAVAEAHKRGGPRILLLLSGGASALLTLPPPGVDLEAIRTVTDQLLRAGAPIDDLNAVRKHLDRLKGGGLAREAGGVPIRALVLSDVVGDRLDVIASGPVSPDPTTYRDALIVLREHGLRFRAPASILTHLEAGHRGEVEETPEEGNPCFRSVGVRIVGNAGTAVEAARATAERREYGTRLLGTAIEGEARDVGRRMGRLARRVRDGQERMALPACIIGAGETRVTVTGDGRGGRNQEVALSAAREIDGRSGILFASLGTDGVDGPTDAAGAVVDGGTLERARSRGWSVDDALKRNDAYPALESAGDLLLTGPTGTNVMDLYLMLVSEAGSGAAP